MPGSEIAILLIMLAYAAISGIVLRRWRRGRRQRPADLHSDPDPAAWIAFWLPQLIGADAFALAGAEICWLLVAQLTPILRDVGAPAPESSYVVGGVVTVLIFVVILFAVIDVVFFVLPARVRLQRLCPVVKTH